MCPRRVWSGSGECRDAVLPCKDLSTVADSGCKEATNGRKRKEDLSLCAFAIDMNVDVCVDVSVGVSVDVLIC